MKVTQQLRKTPVDCFIKSGFVCTDSPENMLEEVDEGSDCPDSDEGGNESNGSERSEGKLYFLTSLGQHEELQEEGISKTNGNAKQIKNRRRKRGDLIRALSAAWNCGRGGIKERASNGQRAAIRKTLLPVSCPVCFKVLSNAYNLKVRVLKYLEQSTASY